MGLTLKVIFTVEYYKAKFFFFPEHSHHRFKNSKPSKKFNERPQLSATYSASKSSKKNRHRAYRDESGEPSNRPSSSIGQTRPVIKQDHRPEEAYKVKEAHSSRNSPQVVWQDSYGMKVNDPTDENYSKEETAGEESAERYILDNLGMFDY